MVRSNPDQGEFFAPDRPGNTEHVRIYDLPADLSPGPHVNIAQRAEAILYVSPLLGMISSRMAWKELMETPGIGDYVRMMREEQDDLAPLDEKITVEDIRAGARSYFESFYGIDALVDAGLVDVEQAASMATGDFAQFQTWYNHNFGGEDNKQAREAYRRRLRKTTREFRRTQ